MNKEDKSSTAKSLSKSPAIEVLRLTRTSLEQEAFIRECGFVRATYFRWLRGSEAKLTLKQIKKLARVLNIEKIAELPDDLSPGT